MYFHIPYLLKNSSVNASKVDWTEEQWRNSSAPAGSEEHCFVYDVNYNELEPGQIIPNGERDDNHNKYHINIIVFSATNIN